MQAGLALLREQHAHDFGNGLLDTERRVRSAEIGANPARSHQYQSAPLFGIVRRVAPHELVQGGLASAIDVVPAFFVVADASLSASLVAAITEAAAHVRLRFAPKPEKDARPLREGQIDLEIGVLGAFAPEVRTQALFRDRFVGVARIGHPLLSGVDITPERYATCDHVVASRRGEFTGPVDDALKALGLQRIVSVVVPGFPDAMRIARYSDLVALVPRSCLGNGVTNDQSVTAGLQSFELPVRTPEIVMSAMWHPRMDADPAHRWLRDTLVSLCRTAYPRH